MTAGIHFLAPVLLLALAVAYYLGKRSKQKKNTQTIQPVPAATAAASVQASSGNDFAGQVAIITGGGTGLGKAMAMEMAKRGAKIVIASRNPEHLNSTAAEIQALGAEVLTFPFDVRKPDQVQGMVDATIARFGQIDILVNNAAGNFLVPAEKLTTNGWNAVIGIVLNGTWNCTSAVGKVMIAQRKGVILNIVANYASSGSPGVVHSAAAKAGVLSMTRTLAVEWGGYGIRVNALAPGAMVTKGASANLQFDSDKAQRLIASRIPTGRLTSAEEMARYAAFLCSEQSCYMNGDLVTADGGQGLPRGFLDLKEQLGV